MLSISAEYDRELAAAIGARRDDVRAPRMADL